MTKVNRSRVASHRPAAASNEPKQRAATHPKRNVERFRDSFEPAPSAKKHAGKFHNNHRGGRIELRATTPIPPELNPTSVCSPVEATATPAPSFTVGAKSFGPIR